jgi:Lar family restriction alleviation protein
MGEELLPCPFCGCTNIVLGAVTFGHGDMGGRVKCENCGASVPDDYIGRSAKEKWNTRVTGE